MPFLHRLTHTCTNMGESLLLLLARFALAAVFWLSGQTKIDGFALNPFAGSYQFGWPEIKPSTYLLFQYEYNLPLISASLAAIITTLAEHLQPILLMTGLATRVAAVAILVMTLVIEIFVYPQAYATHATWAALALLLIMKGGGKFSVDNWISRR